MIKKKYLLTVARLVIVLSFMSNEARCHSLCLKPPVVPFTLCEQTALNGQARLKGRHQLFVFVINTLFTWSYSNLFQILNLKSLTCQCFA